jgi:hypothetical protein
LKGHDFGRKLSSDALVPLHQAFDLLCEGKVIAGLAEVSRDKLFAGLRSGVDAVAARLGVKPAAVEALLPWETLMNQVERLECARIEATSTFERYAASVGGLLTGLAGATVEVDRRKHSAAQALTNVSRRFAREKGLVEPLKALAAELEDWEDAMVQAGALVDGSDLLRRYFRRQRLLRTLAVVLTLVAIVTASAAVIRTRRIASARQALDGRIAAATDPCAVETIPPEALEHALPAQLSRIDEKKKSCEEQRARARYVAACEGIAKGLEAGKLAAEDETTAGLKDPARLRRAAAGALSADDLAATAADMPCKDTPSKDRIWIAYGRAAARSTAAWAEGPRVSDDLRKLLASPALAKETAYKSALAPDADEEARKAIRSGDPASTERARRLCEFQEAWGVELGKNCKGYLAIARALGKKP